MKLLSSLSIVLLLCSPVFDVEFTYTPSPNIGVYQLAHYQCSVDHTGVSITWYVNGTASDHIKIIKLGVVKSGGSQGSNLTIPGYPQYNNTEVKCLASGFVDGIFYSNFDNATLRIQGQLTAVNNLTCHVQSQYINCSWSSPFSLISIPDYILKVTCGGELVTQNTTSSTTWQYCPSQFGTYTISVAGNNLAGEGEITTTSVIVPEDSITNYYVTLKRQSNDTYSIDVIIQTVYSLLPTSISINLTAINGAIFIANGKADVIGNEILGNINIGTTGRQKWSVNLILNYDCKSLNNDSPAKTISTFNVQNGNVTVINSTIGKVCYTCHFLEGSQPQGCYIEYNSLITDYYSGNITIVRTSEDNSTASKCVTGIYTSNYNMTFYDMDYNNNIYMEEYAVKLTNQSVIGLSPPPTLSIPTSISSNVTTTTLSFPSPTLCLQNCDDMGSVQGDLHIIIPVIVVVAATVLILVTVIIVVIILIMIVLRKVKTRKCINNDMLQQDNGWNSTL